MKVTFLKDYGFHKEASTIVVNDKWGNWAIAKGIVKNASISTVVDKLPIPEGKGKDIPEEEVKKKNTTKRRRKNVTQSKKDVASSEGQR